MPTGLGTPATVPVLRRPEAPAAQSRRAWTAGPTAAAWTEQGAFAVKLRTLWRALGPLTAFARAGRTADAKLRSDGTDATAGSPYRPWWRRSGCAEAGR